MSTSIPSPGLSYTLGPPNTNTILVSGYNGSDTDIVIPSQVNGLNVVMISDNAFSNNQSITSIYAPSVIQIGNYAFNQCYALTSVTFSPNLYSIGNYAFNVCQALTSIDLSSVIVIGEHTFSNCGLTGNVDISLVNKIPSLAFECCSNLTSVTMSPTILWIGDYAFYNCPMLTMENLTIYNYIPIYTQVQAYAFMFTGTEPIDYGSNYIGQTA